MNYNIAKSAEGQASMAQIWLDYLTAVDDKHIAWQLTAELKQAEDFIKNVARRYFSDHDTVEEIAQIVFIKLWENRHKPSYTIKGDPHAFLYTLTKNECLQYLRSLKSKPVIQSLDIEIPMYDQTEEKIDLEVLRDWLRQALPGRRKAKRRFIMLALLEGDIYEEIAEQLSSSSKQKITPKQVRQIVSHTRKELRQLRHTCPIEEFKWFWEEA